MSRLTEKFIQKTALEYLKEHYAENHQATRIFGRTEVRTSTAYYGKRADGLLSFHSAHQLEHTVSIEAKSHKTLGSLLPYWDDQKMTLHVLLSSITLGLLTIVFTHHLAWYWVLAIALFSIPVLMFLEIALIALVEPNRYKLVNVVHQVHQYPANEKWIAISRDSLNLAQKKTNPQFHRKSDYENFIQVCRKQNIGIIVITRRTSKILLQPQFIPGYFLDCYATGDQIRQSLKTKPPQCGLKVL